MSVHILRWRSKQPANLKTPPNENTNIYLMKTRTAFNFCLAASWMAAGLAFAGNQDTVDAAKMQIGVTTVYDPAYVQMAFPGGDVPAGRGVCTDVIVRALRVAKRIDLQAAINADMRARPLAYPKKWGLTNPATDPHIDHRRVPNQMVYLEKQGYKLPLASGVSAYRAGDIVAWNLKPSGLKHIGIISDKKSSRGTPLVIHNIGRGTQEENILLEHELIGHYRVAPPAARNLPAK
jgi:uncharacterized protein